MRIDAHAHVLPVEYQQTLERHGLLAVPLPPFSEEILEAMMDRHAIDAAVLSLSPPGVWFGDQGLANELARLVNESVAGMIRTAPGRYAGLAYLPLPDLGRALTELDYALDVLGLDGVALVTNVDGIYHGDPVWEPLWAELGRRDCYVMLHPTLPGYALPLPAHPPWQYEFPFETTRALTNLIYSGTLNRHPGVRLQAAHLGGTIPFLSHRIASVEVREPEKATHAGAGALAAFAQLFYDTGLSNHEQPVRAAIAASALRQVVFGTDWPYAALPPAGDPAPELDYLGEDRAVVEAENIGRLVPRLVQALAGG
jgi:6-methylsalicylate decarboxylase